MSFTDADVYAIDVASGKTTNLTEHTGKTLNTASSLSRRRKDAFDHIQSKGRLPERGAAGSCEAKEKLTWVTDTRWEASAGDFSPDGKRFTYAINADGRADVFMGDTATLKSEKIPIGGGVNGFGAIPKLFFPFWRPFAVVAREFGRPGGFLDL